MNKMKKTDTCFFCKRIISQHSRCESIECALKLCNGNEVVGSACGSNEQLIQKPARCYPKEDSS